MSEITEFDYHLTQRFSYHFKGQQTEASFITLKAPTSRNLAESGALSQAFGRAQAAHQDRPSVQAAIAAGAGSAEEDVKIAGSDVILGLISSTAVDYPEVLAIAKKLFSGGVALVEGETKLSVPLIDLMSVDDFEAMLGDYLVNFTLASLLTSTKTDSSSVS